MYDNVCWKHGQMGDSVVSHRRRWNLQTPQQTPHGTAAGGCLERACPHHLPGSYSFSIPDTLHVNALHLRCKDSICEMKAVLKRRPYELSKSFATLINPALPQCL